MSALYGSGATFTQGQENKFALWPGAVLMYDVLDYLFVGAEARYHFVSVGTDQAIVGAGGGTANAFGLYGTVGFRIPH